MLRKASITVEYMHDVMDYKAVVSIRDSNGQVVDYSQILDTRQIKATGIIRRSILKMLDDVEDYVENNGGYDAQHGK